jgi:hypothetical protein
MDKSPEEIRKVHLIFKTHLDVGFTDYAQAVIERYFNHFIPQALELARQMRQSGGRERFVWTTGSFLIYEYLEKAAAEDQRRMEEAILAGDIAWHGLPFTSYSELMDASLYRHGLSLSQRLDQRFGKQTIAAKMTDVPGHTRAIVPWLAEAGIQFLHIGVNAASCPPDVPPVCVWRDPAGAELVLMYHKSSYGESMIVPGLEEAVQFAFTNDNLGPQTPEAVRDIFKQAQRDYPQAEVVASNLDAYARALLQIKDSLPVFTQEIGDTWIHGVGTDPKKVAQFRTLQRLRRDWLKEGLVNASDANIFAFSQELLKVAEHTWGMDIKVHLGDFETYEKRAFQAKRGQDHYRKVEASWAEQRAYIQHAAQTLGNTPNGIEAQRELNDLEPQTPDQRGYLQVYDLDEPIDTTHFSLRFNEHGALCGLQDRISGIRIASEEHTLGAFLYETFSQADYERYYEQYNPNKSQTWMWALPDFTKPGIDSCRVYAREWAPALQGLWKRLDNQGDTILVEMHLPEEATHHYGCPRRLSAEYWLSKKEPVIYLTLQWFQKDASRLPEAIWLSFNPKTARPDGWQIEKLGQFISPLEVVRNGNRRLHAIDRGILYDDGQRRIAIESLDAPLVAPGQRGLLKFDQEQPELSSGMHFNLYNNIWGTNHPMWYEEDARFRFILNFS